MKKYKPKKHEETIVVLKVKIKTTASSDRKFTSLVQRVQRKLELALGPGVEVTLSSWRPAPTRPDQAKNQAIAQWRTPEEE